MQGGVSNVDIDGNNALQIKAIGVVISTFETLPNKHHLINSLGAKVNEAGQECIHGAMPLSAA
jgi:hypothetical protein